MKLYQDLLRELLYYGHLKTDRTGTGTLSKFGHQMRLDLQDGFPLLTTKEVHLKSVIHELLWFLSGGTNIKYLQDNGVTIWDGWADERGELGPIYGQQWRKWIAVSEETDSESDQQWRVTEIDQIREVVNGLVTRPNSRRHIVSAWNVAELPDENLSPQQNVKRGKMALAPCHCLLQFYVDDGKLSCQLYQRSADVFIGLPFNLASYALLTQMIAQQCDLDVGDLIWTGGDVHLYLNHQEQAKLQLTREPYSLPKMRIRKARSIFDYDIEDFDIVGYQSHPAIRAEVSV